MNNIIFVEGLPGSGKSTFAKKIKTELEKQKVKVELYNEGDLHPIDLAWCSIVEKTKFQQLLNKYSKYRSQILSKSKEMDNKIITAYTQVRVEDQDVAFYREFEKYEIYKEDDYDNFKNTHLQLWQNLASVSDDSLVYIFECIFLQNHINELILKFNLSVQDIIEYFIELSSQVKSMNPLLIYIKQCDVDNTMNRIIEERRSNNPVYKDWIVNVYEYFQATKFGEKLGYIGEEGALNYFKDRQAIELQVIPKIPIKSEIIELEDNYDEVFEKIKAVIK